MGVSSYTAKEQTEKRSETTVLEIKKAEKREKGRRRQPETYEGTAGILVACSPLSLSRNTKGITLALAAVA